MEQREPPPSSYKVKMELDRLSNLPCHITEKILKFLPIKDVTRTSVLSTKWRYRSTKLENLVFDEECVTARKKTTFVNIVDHVLLLHVGPINKFQISNQKWRTTTDVDRWILYLTRSSVKEFIFENWKGPRFTMPSCLFSLQEMTHLELFSCLLTPPSTFTGFRSLKSLDIQHVTLAQDVFENLIVRCPLLKRLTLINFDGFTDLNIDAPNLEFIDVGGYFEDVNFVNTINLAVASVSLFNHMGNHQRRSPRKSGNLVKFFTQLPHVRRLKIQRYFLQYLADGVVSGELPKLCLDLTLLLISINFNVWEEVLTSVFLLRSSPSLQELEIVVRSTTRKTKSSQVYDNCIGPFAQLRHVKIVGISNIKSEVDLIRFLLSNSPMLEKMTVRPASGDCGWELVKQLLQLKRASANAEIICLDP